MAMVYACIPENMEASGQVKSERTENILAGIDTGIYALWGAVEVELLNQTFSNVYHHTHFHFEHGVTSVNLELLFKAAVNVQTRYSWI